MACVISTGDRNDEGWIVRNDVYSWFAGLAKSCCTDEELSRRLTMSELVNGLALDALLGEDSVVARRLAMVLRSVARDVATGRHALTDLTGRPPLRTLQQEVEVAFARLVELLDAWPPLSKDPDRG